MQTPKDRKMINLCHTWLAFLLASCAHTSTPAPPPVAVAPAPAAAPVNAPAPAVNASAASPAPLGYAAAVTGGSALCMFDDLPTLRACVAKPGNLAEPSVQMTVALGLQRIEQAAGVTLNGLGLLTVQADGYGVNAASNDIIRNVTFVGPGPSATLQPADFKGANCTTPTTAAQLLGCAVMIQVMPGVTGVLIDHDSFSDCGDKCVSIDSADDITISNSRFADSFFAVLALGRDTTKPYGHVTVTGNLFDTVFRRSARASGAMDMHEYANVFTGQCPSLPGGGFGPSAVGTAQALIEDNYADPGSCSAVNVVDYDNLKTEVTRGPGIALARGNTGIADVAGAITFKPTYAYSLPGAATVRASVLVNAGVQPQ